MTATATTPITQTLAGVIRVSHLGRRDPGSDAFHADDDQVRDIEAYARTHSARLVMLPPELNVSGGLPLERRPSLIAAIEGVERGEYDGIIVAYLSRLGRNVREQLRAWDRVEGAGGRIVVVKEGIDTSTWHGRLHRDILLSVAEAEREMHVERFEDVRRDATAAGVWQRRQVPRGYSKRHDERGVRPKLVPNEQADEVRQAFLDRGRGASVADLARRLGMTSGGAAYLLRNRVYLGELRVGKYVNPSAHPPLVTEEIFEAAQGKQPRPPRTKQYGGPALLAGVIRCAACGHLMSRSGNAKRAVYCCPVFHSGERCPAPAAITCAILDAYVERIADAELLRLTVSALEGQGITAAQEAVVKAERELGAYLAAVSADEIGPEAFGLGARQRHDAVREAKSARDAERRLHPHLPWEQKEPVLWNATEANTVLRSLFAAVVVRRGGGRGSRTHVDERVRVVAFGANLGLPVRRGAEPTGIFPLVIDLDDPHVLRPPGAEDRP
jgi:DNA invertase Pin-like site-specific DNA recombinase